MIAARLLTIVTVKVPKPAEPNGEEDNSEEVPLPQTLVRIPVAQPGEGSHSEEDPS